MNVNKTFLAPILTALNITFLGSVELTRVNSQQTLASQSLLAII